MFTTELCVGVKLSLGRELQRGPYVIMNSISPAEGRGTGGNEKEGVPEMRFSI